MNCLRTLVIIALASASIAHAASNATITNSTWSSTPADGNWFNNSNWNNNTTPDEENDSATFGGSSIKDINISGNLSLSNLTVTEGSGEYSFTVNNSANASIGVPYTNYDAGGNVTGTSNGSIALNNTHTILNVEESGELNLYNVRGSSHLTLNNNNSTLSISNASLASSTANINVSGNDTNTTLTDAILNELNVNNTASDSDFTIDGNKTKIANADISILGDNSTFHFNTGTTGALANSTLSLGNNTTLSIGVDNTHLNLNTINITAGDASITFTANNQSLTLGDDNSSTDLTNATISGNGSLVKNGTGNLTLDGTNTHTGGTKFNNGTLYLNSATAIQNSTLSITTNANLIIDDTLTELHMGGLDGAGNISLSSNLTQLFLNSDTVNGSFSGNLQAEADVDLIKTGGATQTFTNNSFDNIRGNVTVNNGTLAVEKSKLAAPSLTVDGFTGNTAAILSLKNVESDETQFSVSGNQSILKLEDGTSVSNATLQLKEGASLHINTSSNLIFNSINSSGNTSLSSGEILIGASKNVTIQLGEDDSDSDLSNTAINQTDNFTTNNTTTIIKNGSGNLTLGQAGNYTGITLINNGTLNVDHESALGHSVLELSANASLNINASLSELNLGGLNGDGNITLGNNLSDLNLSSEKVDGVFGGNLNVQGTTNITKTGAANQTFTNNTFAGISGEVNVLEGKLIVNNSTVSSTSFIANGFNLNITHNGNVTDIEKENVTAHIVLNNATLTAGTNFTVTGNSSIIRLEGNSIVSSGTLNLSEGATFAINSTEATEGSGEIIHSLDSITSTYNSAAGNLAVSQMLIGATTNVTIELGNSNTDIDLSYASINQSSGYNRGGYETNIIKNGSGNLIMGQEGNYTGNTIINGGDLYIDHGKALGTSVLFANDNINVTFGANISNATFGGIEGNVALTVTENFTLYVGNGSRDSTYNGILSGNGTLQKSGSGSFTLNSNLDAFSGNMVLSGGHLVLEDISDTALGNAGLTLKVNDKTALTIKNGTSITNDTKFSYETDAGFSFTIDNATYTKDYDISIRDTHTLTLANNVTLGNANLTLSSAANLALINTDIKDNIKFTANTLNGFSMEDADLSSRTELNLTLNGKDGTLSISGNNNTYSANTGFTLNNGTSLILTNTSLSDSDAKLKFDSTGSVTIDNSTYTHSENLTIRSNSTFTLANNSVLGNANISVTEKANLVVRNATLNTDTFSHNATGCITLDEAVYGGQDLTVADGATLYLSNNNTLSANINISDRSNLDLRNTTLDQSRVLFGDSYKGTIDLDNSKFENTPDLTLSETAKLRITNNSSLENGEFTFNDKASLEISNNSHTQDSNFTFNNNSTLTIKNESDTHNSNFTLNDYASFTLDNATMGGNTSFTFSSNGNIRFDNNATFDNDANLKLTENATFFISNNSHVYQANISITDNAILAIKNSTIGSNATLDFSSSQRLFIVNSTIEAQGNLTFGEGARLVISDGEYTDNKVSTIKNASSVLTNSNVSLTDNALFLVYNSGLESHNTTITATDNAAIQIYDVALNSTASFTLNGHTAAIFSNTILTGNASLNFSENATLVLAGADLRDADTLSFVDNTTLSVEGAKNQTFVSAIDASGNSTMMLGIKKDFFLFGDYAATSQSIANLSVTSDLKFSENAAIQINILTEKVSQHATIDDGETFDNMITAGNLILDYGSRLIVDGNVEEMDTNGNLTVNGTQIMENGRLINGNITLEQEAISQLDNAFTFVINATLDGNGTVSISATGKQNSFAQDRFAPTPAQKTIAEMLDVIASTSNNATLPNDAIGLLNNHMAGKDLPTVMSDLNPATHTALGKIPLHQSRAQIDAINLRFNAARASESANLVWRNVDRGIMRVIGATDNLEYGRAATLAESPNQPTPLYTYVNDPKPKYKWDGYFSSSITETSIDGNINSYGHTSKAQNFFIGADTFSNDRKYFLGAQLAFTSSNLHVDPYGSAKVSSWRLGGYMSRTLDKSWFLQGIVSASMHDYDTTRNNSEFVYTNGTDYYGNLYKLKGTGIDGSTDALAFGGSIAIGKDWYLHEVYNWKSTILLRLSADHIAVDGFEESDDFFPFAIDKQTNKSVRSSLEWSVGKELVTAAGNLWIAKARLAWEHEFIDPTWDLNACFATTEDRELTRRNFIGPEYGSELFSGGLELQCIRPSGWTFSGSLIFDWGSGYDDRRVNLLIGRKF